MKTKLVVALLATVSTLTAAAERGDSAAAQESYGGVVAGLFQAGGQNPVASRNNLFAHH